MLINIDNVYSCEIESHKHRVVVYLAPSFFAGKLLIETTQCVCICMRARVCVYRSHR